MQTTPVDGTLTDLSARIAKYQHPAYLTWLPIWRTLAHVREGVGGFLDGTYLIPHPREYQDFTSDTPSKPTKKLLARRALACYENFAATIIEAKKSALFRETPLRRVGAEKKTAPMPIELWWQDVDGCGADIDDFMQRAWDAAATFGKVVLYLDRPQGNAPTAADSQRPFIRLYTPIDMPDWLENELGHLTAVKLLEGSPREAFDLPLRSVATYQIRTVSETGWSLHKSSGQAISQGPITLGRLPIIELYAQRRPMLPHVGQSVLFDPQMYVDIYNLTSEVRELLRNQTFGILNVEVGTGPDAISVADVQAMLGSSTGTENVLFSPGKAGFISPATANVTAYQDELERRLRTIYRLAAIQWEADSLHAEAKGSLQLKREDMNQRLSMYADECESTEYAIADLWYRLTYGADLGPKRLQQDGLLIRYPDNFDVTPFASVLEQAQAALSLGMPSAFLKTLRKSLVTKFLPDLPDEEQKAIGAAIDAAPDDLSAAEQTAKAIKHTMANLSMPLPSGVAKVEAAQASGTEG